MFVCNAFNPLVMLILVSYEKYLQQRANNVTNYVVQIIHSARANATHNHGLDPDRLLVGI